MKLLGLIFLLTSSSLWAANHEIKLLNKGSDGQAMVFEPDFLKIAPGDSVKFVPVNPGHNVEALKEGTPAGAPVWKGGSSKEITVKFDVEGVHVIKCLPHFAMGMIGAIQVGKPTNLGIVQALKFNGKVKDRFAKILAKIK